MFVNQGLQSENHQKQTVLVGSQKQTHAIALAELRSTDGCRFTEVQQLAGLLMLAQIQLNQMRFKFVLGYKNHKISLCKRIFWLQQRKGREATNIILKCLRKAMPGAALQQHELIGFSRLRRKPRILLLEVLIPGSEVLIRSWPNTHEQCEV